MECQEGAVENEWFMRPRAREREEQVHKRVIRVPHWRSDARCHQVDHAECAIGLLLDAISPRTPPSVLAQVVNVEVDQLTLTLKRNLKRNPKTATGRE